MIRFLNARDLKCFPRLSQSMFVHRAEQFKRRLNWKVSVDGSGQERDEYDDANPLYVIWQTSEGLHAGSMRLMPTLGPTMIRDHFGYLAPEERYRSGTIYECTRFCLAPTSSANMASILFLAGAEFMRQRGIDRYVGVASQEMLRLYRRIGVAPEVIGMAEHESGKIAACLWRFSDRTYGELSQRVGITRDKMEAWYLASVSEELDVVNMQAAA